MTYFSIRTNDQTTIRKVLDLDTTINVSGITWLHDRVQQDDLVFIVLSGDSSKKQFPYDNGLKAIAKVIEKHIDAQDTNNKVKSYSVKLELIIHLPKVITKKDFYLYPDLLDCPNIGPETKSSPNQALGIINNGVSVLIAINDLYPNVLSNDLLNLIPKNTTIKKAELKESKEVSIFLDREEVVKQFILWFNQPENIALSYKGVDQKGVLLSWDNLFFNGELFNIDLNNYEHSKQQIRILKKYMDKNNQDWISFSSSTASGKGAPSAILGEKNYLKFLEKFDLSKYTLPSYTVDDIQNQGCFIDKDKLESYIHQLKTKKNIILQGPPGTGKTWLAQQLAKVIVKHKTQKNIQNVQFHPNYAYEDLIRGWRPRSDGKLSLVDGPFLEMISLAQKNPQQNFVFIFDEINRGDPSVIFGEMLTLLETTKRNAQYALSLTYLREDFEKIYIPENLYVIGTMNTADKSLNNMDFAFRRRFSFFTLEPLFNTIWENWLKNQFSMDDNLIERIKTFVNTLNNDIKNKNGSPYLLGHSFFVPSKKLESKEEQIQWINSVIDNEIKPLLTEYWYDDLDKVEKIGFE